MIWYLLIALSLGAGLLRLPAWTAWLGPVASLAVGVFTVFDEPPGYDMPGAGYIYGALFAGACLVAWTVGRGAAALIRRNGD